MLISLDHADGTPLYEQLARAISEALAAGDLADGERLPSARELAAQLDVNMHTVLRAYAALSDEGLLKVRRGRGAVAVAPPALPAPVRTALDRLVTVAERHGVTREQIANALKGAT